MKLNNFKTFCPYIACKCSVNISVFVTELNSRNEMQMQSALCLSGQDYVILEDHIYCPFTLEDLAEIFPFWSTHQIRRIKNDAIKLGVLLQDNFNSNPLDRRLWYAVSLSHICESCDMSAICRH